MNKSFRLTVLALSVSIALSACGGGGSGSGTSYDNRPSINSNIGNGNNTDSHTNVPEKPIDGHLSKGIANSLVKDNLEKASAPNLHINDYQDKKTNDFYDEGTDNYLNIVNQKTAADQNLTGNGVVVGVADGDLDFRRENEEAIKAYQKDGKTSAITNTKSNDKASHASAVVSVLAGRIIKNHGRGGVAKDADIVVASTVNKELSKTPSAWRFLYGKGARIINNSWGTDRGSNEDGFDTYNSLYDEYKQVSSTGKGFSLVKELNDLVEKNTLFLFAAGNQKDTQPSSFSLIPRIEPNTQKGLIAVVGVDDKGQISVTGKNTGSNHCGLAANWCLSAPYSVSIVRNSIDPSVPDGLFVQELYGTSFSTPIVSGAAALVLQKYNWFTNDNLRTTLLTTAQDLGAKGVDSVYGWGLLNIGKAVDGPAQFAFGDFVANVNGKSSDSWRFGNDISGTGGLIKRGASELILKGKHTYTGKTRVEGGVLTIDGSLKSNTVVGAKGALNLRANAKVGSVENHGWLMSGNGNATINGNLDQKASGAFYTRLGDVLHVTGRATVAGHLRLDGTDKYVRATGTKVPFLTANGGVSGQFNSVKTDSALIGDTSLVHNADGKTLTYTVKRNSVVSTSEKIDVLPVFKDVVAQSAQNVESAMKELDTWSDEALDNSSFVRSAIALQSENADNLVNKLLNLSATTYANGASVYAMEQGKHVATVANALDGSLKKGEVSALVQYTHSDSDWKNEGATGDLNANGIVLGVNTRLTDKVSLTAAYSQNHINWSENVGGNSEVDSNGLLLGTRYELPYNSYLKGILGYNSYDMDVKRSLKINGSEAIEGDVDGHLWQFGLFAGKTWGLGENRWLLNAEGGLHLDWLHQDAFNETGDTTGFAWNGQKVNKKTPVSVLALKTSYAVTPNVHVFGKVGVEHDLNRGDYAVGGQFTGANKAQGKTATWSLPRTRSQAAIGVGADLGKGWSLNGQYTFTGSKQYKDHAIKVGVGFKF